MYGSFCNGGNGFTAWGVRIHTPETADNTDGIDLAGATDITIVRNHVCGTRGISIGSETSPDGRRPKRSIAA